MTALTNQDLARAWNLTSRGSVKYKRLRWGIRVAKLDIANHSETILWLNDQKNESQLSRAKLDVKLTSLDRIRDPPVGSVIPSSSD